MTNLSLCRLSTLTLAVAMAMTGCGGGGGSGGGGEQKSPTANVSVAPQPVQRSCIDTNDNFHCDATEPASGQGPSLQMQISPETGEVLSVLAAPAGLAPSAYHTLLRAMQLISPDLPLATLQQQLAARLGPASTTLEAALQVVLKPQAGWGLQEQVLAVTATSLANGRPSEVRMPAMARDAVEVAGFAKAGSDEQVTSMAWQGSQLLVGTSKPNRLLLLSADRQHTVLDVLPSPRREVAMMHAMGGASGVITRPQPPKPPVPLPPAQPGSSTPTTPTHEPIAPSEGLSQLVAGADAHVVFAVMTATKPTVQSTPCRALSAGEVPSFGVFRWGVSKQGSQIALDRSPVCVNDGISQVVYRAGAGQLLALDGPGKRILQLDAGQLALQQSWPLPAKPVHMALANQARELWVAQDDQSLLRIGLDGQALSGWRLATAPSGMAAQGDWAVVVEGQQISVYHTLGAEPRLIRQLRLPGAAQQWSISHDWLAVSLPDQRVQVYHLGSGQLRADAWLPDPINQLALHGDRLHIVAGGNRWYRLDWRAHPPA
ncbi:hypothetical protein HNQ59_000065 [Chitinivorax tropicus]|uniref:WD40 repeat domain-containing protein n=1 Tax=Chitinivorax tropicus TaxID=714531 RepID=A0A840MKY4_9PROT|nr:hypothetical protein [Chitinivorax tropicus]MBB5016803.1 hypothetical protein [Chitinivorax tropicus]